MGASLCSTQSAAVINVANREGSCGGPETMEKSNQHVYITNKDTTSRTVNNIDGLEAGVTGAQKNAKEENSVGSDDDYDKEEEGDIMDLGALQIRTVRPRQARHQRSESAAPPQIRIPAPACPNVLVPVPPPSPSLQSPGASVPLRIHKRANSEIPYNENLKHAKRKWIVAGIDDVESKWTFDFESKSLPSLEGIRWEDVDGVQKSAEGSQGVFFVSTPDGAVVVKSSIEMAAEVLSSKLATRLEIRGPDVRVLSREHDEGQRLLASLIAVESRQHPDGRTVVTKLNRRHFMVMEYLHGIPFENVHREQMEVWFGPTGSISKSGRRILRQMGSLAAFDMILNNSDRLPLIWNNNGNAGNLLLDKVTGDVISLDNCMVAIDPNRFRDNLKSYLEKVSKVVREVEANRYNATNHTAVPQTMKLREFISRTTNHDIGAEGQVEIEVGIRDFFDRCRKHLPIHELIQLKESVLGYPGSCEMTGSHLIRLDYFQAVLSVIESKGSIDVHKAIDDAVLAHSSQIDHGPTTP